MTQANTHTARLGVTLGIAQTVAWGTLYYAIAVLAPSMERDLQLDHAQLFGVFTASLGLSGVLAPWAGRLVDRRGGRAVLTTGLLLGALGFLILSVAHSGWSVSLGWLINGVAMALGLYETCFAAIGQAAPESYRRTVTSVTLIAGLASTVFWPVSHYLVDACGWRGTCAVFAGLLISCTALYSPLPWRAPKTLQESSSVEKRSESEPASVAPARASGLALAFAGSALVSSALSAHLVTTLNALRFSDAQSVWLASSIGVLQVIGRLVEFRTARLSPYQLGLLTFLGIFAALLFLLGSSYVPALVVLFCIAYGASNGVMTIVRAVLPLEMFGRRNVGALLGRFSAPSLIARAVAPWTYALLQGSTLGTVGALSVSVATAALALAGFVASTRPSRA